MAQECGRDTQHKFSLDIGREQEVDVKDDLVLELAFYTQTLEGTRQALLKFQSKRLLFSGLLTTTLRCRKVMVT